MKKDDARGGRGLGPTGETVRANIRRLREHFRMSAPELSKKVTDCGRPINTLGIRRIESGERRVDADDLVALAIAFEVSPATLLMPVANEIVDAVTVTGMEGPAAADGVWQWLRGRMARPGVEHFRIETWPKWERDEWLSRVNKLVATRRQGNEVKHDPKTLPEFLDAAQTPEEFGAVLMGFFAAFDKARENDDDD